MKKLSLTEFIIIVTILTCICIYVILPAVLLKIYGSTPVYEVPTWVIYFLRMRGY